MIKEDDGRLEIKSSKFKMTKAIDLINRFEKEPEPRIIWNGIIEGSKGLIAGVSKTGKTTIAENLAMSIAVGRNEFFGYPLCGNPEKVLFLNLEESPRVRTMRNRRQFSTLNETERSLFAENYLSTPEGFPEFLANNTDWSEVRNYINDSEAKYVFIDSLSHMFEGQIEVSKPALEFVKQFRKYIMSLDKTIIVVHHNTKGNDKPIDQDGIAGSRIIAQEFEYAIGLANIPTHTGGNYMCMLYNKYIEKDDTTAILYRVNANSWAENLGTTNKFDLYKDVKVDYRVTSKNRDTIYKYFQSKYSQGSLEITTSELKEHFVNSKVMSKMTLHESINTLTDEGKIARIGKGVYGLNIEDDNNAE